MQKITISIDRDTLNLIDWVADQLALDRSSTIRALCRAASPYMHERASENGIQAESRTDSKQSQGEA